MNEINFNYFLRQTKIWIIQIKKNSNFEYWIKGEKSPGIARKKRHFKKQGLYLFPALQEWQSLRSDNSMLQPSQRWVDCSEDFGATVLLSPSRWSTAMIHVGCSRWFTRDKIRSTRLIKRLASSIHLSFCRQPASLGLINPFLAR